MIVPEGTQVTLDIQFNKAIATARVEFEESYRDSEEVESELLLIRIWIWKSMVISGAQLHRDGMGLPHIRYRSGWTGESGAAGLFYRDPLRMRRRSSHCGVRGAIRK